MTRWVFSAILVAAFAAWSPASALAGEGIVVVELFQSQGCPMCPPATENVNALGERDDLLVLDFAVTYWDRMGWRDTFAKPEFTARQRAYAHGLRRGGLYTPQVVLNGTFDLPGRDRERLESAIAQRDRLPILSYEGGRVAIRKGTAPFRPADVWLVRYDPRTFQVSISAGNNDGLVLPHRNIVREIVRLGRWTGDAQTYRIPRAKNAALKSAVILQNADGGSIIAAAKL